MFEMFKKTHPVSADAALPGRPDPIATAETHAVFGGALTTKLPAGAQAAMFGMGCFWGVERLFWQVPGVQMSIAGYAAGYTPNPTYDEVCTGRTGHNEVVWIAFDPAQVSYDTLLGLFWENHDPTQGMAQGNDIGTQYRSGVYCYDTAQTDAAQASKTAYAARLADRGLGPITTEILSAPTFYFAEAYHQQYLFKNPDGYCGLKGTGVPCAG